MAFLNNMQGVTFTDGTRTAQRSGYMQNQLRKDIGILEGLGTECNWTIAAQEVTVNEGHIFIQGRQVENDISTIDISLATGANEFGYVLCKVDLGQAAGSQVTIATKQQITSLPTLQQDSFKTSPSTAIYEFPIMSYEVSSVSVVSTQDERVIIKDVEFGDEVLQTTDQTIIGAINENKASLDQLPINNNLLINGNFDIWQRGTSFTGGGAYTADRWQKGSSADVARSTDIPGADSKYSLLVTGDGGSASVNQSIENPNNIIDGKQTTVSFWVKGSITTNADAVLKNSTQAVTYETINYNITTAWVKQELTFASNNGWVNDDVIQLFLLSTGSLGAGVEIRYSQVKFEVGDTATDFIVKTEAEELRDCQRYYETGLVYRSGYSSGTGGTSLLETASYKETKRVDPTLTLTNSALINVTNVTQQVTSYDTKILALYPTLSTAGDFRYATEYEADSEL